MLRLRQVFLIAKYILKAVRWTKWEYSAVVFDPDADDGTAKLFTSNEMFMEHRDGNSCPVLVRKHL